MAFLDKTGLTYFYNKIKEKFIQSVNGTTPDTSGNVQINQVPLAENLTSPDAQASVDYFVYRTSGGSASLESGEANLVFINGNTEIEGRVLEQFSATTTNNIICNVDNINTATWRSAVSSNSDVTFTYNVDFSTSAVTDWTSSGGWTPTLSSYGMNTDVISNVSDYSIGVVASASGISTATVVPSTFANSTLGNNNGTYSFVYASYEVPAETSDSSATVEYGWFLNGSLVTVENYGIATTGTAEVNDIVGITWTKGTPNNSTVTIHYIAPKQGTIKVATPSVFQSTGFNQFNKNQFDENSMVISNAALSSNQIIEHTGTYVCYCPAVGGDHGYAAVSINNHIKPVYGMGYCETKPSLGTLVEKTSDNPYDTVSEFSGRFTHNKDGYIVVVVEDTSDLMMGCAWTDYIADIQAQNPMVYVPYSAPSQIPIPTVGYNTSTGDKMDLPTASYGLPRLGNVYDTINFEAATYIQRIGRMAYSAENLIIAQNRYNTYGTPYDYDDTNIFYILDGNSGNPISYQLESNGSFENVSGNPVTSIDFTKFMNSGLAKLLAIDGTLHDKYTLTYKGSTQYDWFYNSVAVQFSSNDGITFSSPISSNKFTIYIPIPSIYEVDDHGTEKFVGTEVPVEAELLYGQNLRDKLRTDVVTISAQELTGTQKAQVITNIGVSLQFHDITVPSSAFASNSAYEDFPYRGAITLSGVTQTMIPQVTFNVVEATSGNFAPVANTYNGGIYIYASDIPENTVTIPTIVCLRGNL